jgi:hypothetical protein
MSRRKVSDITQRENCSRRPEHVRQRNDSRPAGDHTSDAFDDIPSTIANRRISRDHASPVRQERQRQEQPGMFFTRGDDLVTPLPLDPAKRCVQTFAGAMGQRDLVLTCPENLGCQNSKSTVPVSILRGSARAKPSLINLALQHAIRCLQGDSWHGAKGPSVEVSGCVNCREHLSQRGNPAFSRRCHHYCRESFAVQARIAAASA